MVDLIFDGFYCKDCKECHPTLFWHEKYDDYEKNENKHYKKSLERFLQPDEIEPVFKESLAIRGLEKSIEQGNCSICNCLTFFKNFRTNNFVCCDKCKFEDNIKNKKS